MKVSEISEALGYDAVSEKYEDREVEFGYTSDLLSDVMGNAPEECILITIQAHKNTLAVASQLDMPAIVLCNGRKADDEMKATAEKLEIAILSTKDNQFTASYKIYNLINS